ncbi:MAG: hypothetical protein ACREU4_00310 [Burkholderiales bacterium]
MKLKGKRILITQADAFMGPVLCEVFAEHGTAVVADTRSLAAAEAPAAAVAAARSLDVLVANPAFPAPQTEATAALEQEWRDPFAALVDPLPRLAAARSWSWAAHRLCGAAGA